MRYHKHRSALHQGVHSALNYCLGTGVYRRSRLVENHYGRVGNRRAGDGEKLPLPLRKVGSVARYEGVVTFGQAGYKVVCTRKARRGNTFFVGGVQLAVADIFHNRAREQVGILQHHTKRAAQVGLFNLVDIYSVVAYLAVGNVVKPVYEVGDGSLARARRTYEGDLLPGFCIQRNAAENGFAGFVFKVNVEHTHVAAQLCVSNRAVCVVRVLPRPHTRALCALHYLAVLFAGAH